METIAKVRRYSFRDGRKIKEITRDLDLSRNTVRDIIRSGVTARSYSRENQVFPKLGAYLERLGKLLEENQKRPKKRRMNATRLCA